MPFVYKIEPFSLRHAHRIYGCEMLGMIFSLTACVFLCGIIGYLHWFFYRIRAPNLWQWLESNPQSDSAGLVRSDPSRSCLRWHKRLFTFVAGACLACFFFVANLSGYLSPKTRPVFPEVALGQTYLFKSKYGGVYVTYFEYLAVTYGIWIAWGGLLLTGLLAMKLKINLNEGSPGYPLLFFAGSATSMVVCYAIWQACLFVAHS
jgi:hypothetical protein